ncbi:FKBP12-rapamycin complex-associated protein [Angomonas deanei]|uniref:non-specific serine/threonine protein kinase n=1 Tax=Angomonas deanei TaxID=59799 RepID=A0A7G2C5J0_9TRYP|nr:FKBP12-rapamycin complex-associated protein [Angomonas deanei]CAD2214755.1 FAT domain/FKBP12-rapamycin binding domain/Phosphatidylinositol 3- and 4-kinase/FATC domain containing protein, putative [Angomonas deanei]|eukprot:EPY30636.1 FKBP12-rapamycin complex-associated protein [Angomonas deanei]
MRCLVVRLLSFLSYTEKGNQATKQSMRVLPQVFDALTDPPDRFNVELKYVILKYIVKHAQNLQSLCAPLVNSLLQSLRVYQRDQDYIHDAITALKVVCSKLYIEELVGVIVRTLLVCLAEDRKISTNMEKSTAISNNILGTFSILILELQSDFLKYSAYINQTLKACKITSPEFTALNNEIASGAKCVQNANATQALAKESARLVKKCENIVARYLARRGGEMLSSPNATVDLPGGGTVAEDKILVINEARILSSIKSVPLTREEWMKWSEQFSISILQESPYRVFRCTSLAIDNNSKPLVEISPYFTRNVLEVGFRTVWTYGSMSLRTSIVEFYRQVLRQSMSSSTVPDEVLAIILSIVEYMDHMGEVLSLEYSDLSDCAWSRGMLAKALYWREAAYRDSPAATVESLISLYSELEFVESSVGLMNLADEEQHKALLQSSLVKLARYTEALKLTKQELEAEATVSDNSGSDRISKSYAFKKYRSVPRMLHYNNNDSATSFGGVDETGVERRLEIHARLMLCLSELGNYHEVLDEWKKMYAKFKDADATDDGNLLFYLSQYAADASTRLQQWDTLEQVIPWMTKESVYYHIANATLQIVNNNFDEAVAHVADGRTMLLTDLSSLLHESYARAYTGIVVAQELTELEEVAAAKRCEIELGSSDHVHVVSRLWQQRIRLMSANVTVWKQILGVRGLLIPPKQDVTTRVRFVKLCRQEGASDLERFTLQQLIGARNPTLKDITSRSANLKVVMQWVTLLSSSNALGEGSAFGTESELLKRIIDTHYKAGNQVLLSRAYAKLGRKVERSEAVECYKTATLYDPKWYIAWRLWAEANTELLDVEYSDSACTNAIEGFIQSIKLGTSDSTLIQDVLKLLTLWSRHCDRERGLKELRIRVLNVSPRVWNLVVPQLIARLDLGSDDSCKLVAEIVAIVAYNYPHSLIYPLNLCTMSDSERRKKLADEILNVKLLDRYPVLVLQGSIVINELIRVSALIYEQWHEKLEMAANLFFGRNQRKEEMIQVLMPIHDTLNKVPETVVEADFFSSHAKALTEALEWVKTYKTSKNMADLQSAWNLYQVVYKRMDEQIKLSNTLKLQLCSPKLFEARDLSTGIPDTRSESEDGVSKIFSFHDVLAVIPSKQRPKRLGIFTHEGRSQKYLLKGREDLRLDERVMQLFGLVNILMTSDARSCNKYGFQIQRYSVTPLKDTVGVIGWVDACDTLHEVVKYYRERKSITTELEMRMLSRIITFDNVKAYDYLTVMSKVEVIEFLAAHTSGQDIRKAMWSSAPNCEVWMNRRKMYATSLANMSVVGYILGLGDRHPNNIMIQQSTGLVVHIDFGDCFEVAMTRDKFPEKVPFRLTRMLRNALDVSGVDGSFRSAAETSMCVLREGSHTVLALLEAFIQDPLISWRLMNRPGQEPEVSNDKTIEEQINIAKNMNPIQMQESVVESVDGGQRNDASPTLLKHLCCEEVDDVHQGVFILGRLSSKLKGEDFVSSYQTEPLDPKTQVGRLILEATDIANVAQSWSGWYPFW